MSAVTDLDGLRSAKGGGCSVIGSPITADHIDVGVGSEPGHDGGDGTVGQHVDEAVGQKA